MFHKCLLTASSISVSDSATVTGVSVCLCVSTGAVFVRNPLNRELVATFEIIVSVHDNASDIIDMSVSVPNGKYGSSVSLSLTQYCDLCLYLYFFRLMLYI